MPMIQAHRDVAWAIIGRDVILLSLRANRFYAVKADQAEAVRCALTSGQVSDEAALGCLAPLVEAGFLVRNASGRIDQTATALARPEVSMLGDCSPGEHPDAAMTVTAVALRTSARVALLLGRFPQIAASLRKRHGCGAGPGDPAAMRPVVVAHGLSSRLVTTRDRCLSNSIALTWALGRRGIHARLVIGVRTMPFEAHSWVQLGDMVINDDVEHVAPFTPILVA